MTVATHVLEDTAFRYVRILREELREYSFLYVEAKGWIPPLSKLENCARTLAEREPRWRQPYELVLALGREHPASWDDLRTSKSLDALIDLLREMRQGDATARIPGIGREKIEQEERRGGGRPQKA